MRTQEEIHKLIVGTFETELGQRVLEYFTEVFVDRPVYKPGLTPDEVAFREGQRNVITQIKKEIKKEMKNYAQN